MNAKEQYAMALSAIRHCRFLRENRHWTARQKKWIERGVLHYAVERHILDAAVRTIIQMKYDNAPNANWTMSYRCNHWKDQIPF